MLGLDDDAHILELRERFFDGLLEPLRTADTRIQFVHAEAAAFLLNTSAPAHTVIVNDCYVKVHLSPTRTPCSRSPSRRCFIIIGVTRALSPMFGRTLGPVPTRRTRATVVASSAL
jgi:hypothetical protein